MKIDIHGAKVHNLKDVDVSIPKEKLTVVTGLSGSGKSSLAFDTLYAEGQRRYVESLSSYARQFLGRLDKPDVDRIDGLSPAVAIEQRSASGGPRSTVATRTEIMDHLRMLFARIGVTKSPISGEVVRKDRVTDVVDHILKCGAERMMLVAPLAPRDDRSPEDQLRVLQQQGYTRVWTAEGAMRMDSLDEGLILHNLRERFESQQQIYTNVGTILISINPYETYPIYGLESIYKYRRRGNRTLSAIVHRTRALAPRAALHAGRGVHTLYTCLRETVRDGA